MRWLAPWLVALLIIPLAEAAGAPAKKPPASNQFASQELILQWIDGYRLEPEPARLPEAVQAMSRLGLLRDTDGAGMYVGFMAGVLGENPQRAEKLVTGMFPMVPEDQGSLIRAIAYSGLPGWQQLLSKFVERMPARRVLIDRFLSGKEKLLDKLPLETGPAPVDTLWGYYFATGSFAPVKRIVAALDWAKEAKDVNKLTVGSVAKWTLATNASRDKGLLDMLRSELSQKHTDQVRAALKEVVEAAESYETGKIRKDAVAAIEELKRRGPQANPMWTWTSMAIAVGCVAATATGVGATIGVPCVVGGALSSAAGKLWSTP